jgi:tetratricopeptide (TPR) repeat protein
VQIYIHKNGKQYGPCDEATVSECCRTGECSLTDLAIREGLSEWQPLWAVRPGPDGTSGDLDAELQTFENYGLILDSMTSQLRHPDPRTSAEGFRPYEQLLAILTRHLGGIKTRFPETSEALMMECFYYSKCAGLQLFRGNMTAALDLFDRSIDVMDTPAAHLVKASIYENLNRKNEAIRELDWIIANFPDQPEYSPALEMRRQM